MQIINLRDVTRVFHAREILRLRGIFAVSVSLHTGGYPAVFPRDPARGSVKDCHIARLAFHLGIKRIPQSVANEIEAKHGEHDQ